MNNFCMNCGAQLKPSSKFCAECGTKIQMQIEIEHEAAHRHQDSLPPVKKRHGTPKNKMFPTITAVFILAIIIGLISGLSANYPYKKGATVEETISPDKKSKVGDLKKTGWQLELPENTFDSDTQLNMKVLSEQEAAHYNSGGFTFVGTPVQITAGGAQPKEPVTVTLRIPKEMRVSKQNIDDYVAAYYNGYGWEYIFPDITRVSKGYIKFYTPHFSLFGSVKLTEEEKIKLYAKKAAVQGWALEERELDFIEKMGQYYTEAMEKSGLADKTTEGKLLRAIAKEFTAGNLLVAAERGDAVSFTAKVGQVAGNVMLKDILVDPKYASKMGATTVKGVGKAALKIKDKKYKDAAKELSMAFIEHFPVGKAYKTWIEVVNAEIGQWKDYELENAYNAYSINAGSRNTVSDAEWNVMTSTAYMSSYIRRLQTEAKERHCKVHGISMQELEKDISLRASIENNVGPTLRKMLQKRLRSENNIKGREADYYKIIQGFKRDGLLNRGSFRFDFSMDIEDRLKSLLSARSTILEMFGGKMTVLNIGESAEQNLNDAVAMLLIYGEENDKFYEWLEEKGYINREKLSTAIVPEEPASMVPEQSQPPQETADTQRANGEYAWVLVDIHDYKSEEEWTKADAHEAYAVSYSYARGSYSATKTYDWPSNGEDIGGTLELQAVFSGVPEIIYPDKPVSLNLSFTTIKNDVRRLNFGGGAGANFDQWDVNPFGVTRGAIKFTNGDGVSHFGINALNGPVPSYNETLTAKLRGGSEGERIALRTIFSFGVAMGTNYIYEWRQVDKKPKLLNSTEKEPSWVLVETKTNEQEWRERLDSGNKNKHWQSEISASAGSAVFKIIYIGNTDKTLNLINGMYESGQVHGRHRQQT